MKMAHAKLIHMENGGVALSLVFCSLYSPPVGKGSQGGLLGRMDNKRKCI